MKTRAWDPARYLDDPEAAAEYLTAALEDGDPALIAASLGDVARAQGMSDLARKAGLSRESLYRALSAEGHPEFATIMRVLNALGITLSASATKPTEAPELENA